MWKDAAEGCHLVSKSKAVHSSELHSTHRNGEWAYLLFSLDQSWRKSPSIDLACEVTRCWKRRSLPHKVQQVACFHS